MARGNAWAHLPVACAHPDAFRALQEHAIALLEPDYVFVARPPFVQHGAHGDEAPASRAPARKTRRGKKRAYGAQQCRMAPTETKRQPPGRLAVVLSSDDEAPPSRARIRNSRSAEYTATLPGGPLTLTLRDLERCSPTAMLTDAVLMFGMELVRRAVTPAQRRSVRVFGTFLPMKIQSGDITNLRKRWGRSDPFADPRRIWIMPWHVHGDHFLLILVVDLQTCCGAGRRRAWVTALNSMGPRHPKHEPEAVGKLRRFLAVTYRTFRPSAAPCAFREDVLAFQPMTCPQQPSDSLDCGWYCMFFIWALLCYKVALYEEAHDPALVQKRLQRDRTTAPRVVKRLREEVTAVLRRKLTGRG